MRRPMIFAVGLVAAFVAGPMLFDRGSPQHVLTGTVTAFKAGEWISVANEQSGRPEGFPMALRDTVYDGDPDTIKPGVRVTVWFRSVADNRLVADKVLVFAHAAAQ